MQIIKPNEPIAIRRRMFFDIRSIDGVTPANGEAGLQPQISVNCAAWTNAGIGTLALIGNGRYFADITADQLTVGNVILARYKGSATAETPGNESFFVVNYDPFDVPDSVDSVLSASHGADDWSSSSVLSGSVSPSPLVAIGDDINSYVAVDFAATFVANGIDLSDWSQAILTVKDDVNADSDVEAKLTVKKSTSGVGDGLTFLNGVATAGGQLSWGSLSVSFTSTQFTVNANVKSTGMAFDPSGDIPYRWELTVYRGSGTRVQIGNGNFVAARPVRRNPSPVS